MERRSPVFSDNLSNPVMKAPPYNLLCFGYVSQSWCVGNVIPSVSLSRGSTQWKVFRFQRLLHQGTNGSYKGLEALCASMPSDDASRRLLSARCCPLGLGLEQ